MGKRRKLVKRPRGRPPIEPGGVSDVQITVRLGAEIMRRIDQQRGEAGRAAFIRALLKKGLDTLARRDSE